MRRLVDANEIKGHFPQDEDWDYPVNTNSRVVEIIDNAPTVDAIEVVWCKDCKFFRRYGFRLEYAECIKFDFYDTTEDGFCSYGERREDETN